MNNSLTIKKVLIVDDSEDFLDILCGEVATSGVEIAKAHNGQEALNILKSESFDLVISDTQMPKLSGDNLVRELCGKEYCPRNVLLISSLWPSHPIISNLIQEVDGKITGFRFMEKCALLGSLTKTSLEEICGRTE